MKTSQELKTCPSCQASIPGESTHCLYCNVSFESRPEPTHQQYVNQDSLEDSLYSSYKPPYEAREKTQTEESVSRGYESVPDPVYTPTMTLPEIPAASDRQNAEEKKRHQNPLMSILLLSLAVNSALFGALLGTFGKGPTLTLTWSTEHWVYFMVASLPLFLLGMRSMKKLDA